MRLKWLIPGTGLLFLTLLIACGSDDPSGPPGVLELNNQHLAPLWTVSKGQELGCGGTGVAGGHVGGTGDFSSLGESTVDVSAAWDVPNLIQTTPQYTPVGPASGPVAPVLGQSDYPFAFHYDPETGDCQQTVEATGKVVLTAANGDRLYADITGGEAHKLDFIIDGDGVETFTRTMVTGGTGQFSDAAGSFVVHTIVRLTPTFRFEITLAEILPGGTLTY
jgi:hypothetical protein